MRIIIGIILLLSFVAIGLKAQNVGLATYYGKKFNNRKTASGEIYKKDSMVCAHRTYPFGSLQKVKSLKNDKEIIVKVIDRGPFRKKCIIDLSYAAAKELDMVHHGLMKVEVSEYIKPTQDTIKPDSITMIKNPLVE